MGTSVWQICHDVREDAPSAFVPNDDLDGADIGDLVDVTSAAPPAVRHGRVTELVDDAERGRFVVVSFEPANDDATVERETR